MVTWDFSIGTQLIVLFGIAFALWCADFSRCRVKVVSGVFVALQVLAILASIWLFTLSIIYLSFSGYYDHFEAAVASMSLMLFQTDQPLYHGLHSAARYSVSYGPMLYVLDGLPMFLLGGDIATSKISGVVACALAIFVLFRTLRRNCELQLALILIGLFVLSLLIFENYSYWNRPDPFLVLCVVVGLSKASTAPLRSAAIYVGVTTGIALSLKIHGAVYMIPVIALFLMRRPPVSGLTTAIASLMVVSAAPFLLTQISLADYLLSLTVAPRHGLSFSLLIKSVTHLLILMTPVVGLILIGSSKTPSPNLKLLGAAFIVQSIVITIISSKRGAGPHHYLPMLPTLIYICSLLLREQGKQELLNRIRDSRPAFYGFLLLVSSYMVIASMAVRSQSLIVVQLASDRDFKEASHELHQILTRYSGSSMQMGYSDRTGYKFTFLRPLVVAHGNPYWLDAGALMDYDAAGITMATSTIEALETCKTEIWILPATGAPFSMTNYYATGRNIFGGQFGHVFSERYELVQSNKYYAVWKCRSGPS